MSARFHILTQYVWPDDAPTGLYAEHVADGLSARNHEVTLVSGEGSYRAVVRPAPRTPIFRVRHRPARRGQLAQTLREYVSLGRHFERYIREHVRRGDVVVATTAPPSTVFLHRAISLCGGRGVYWLQDYYPELLRGLADYPYAARAALSAFWDRQLGRWNHVVKAAGNLGYQGANATVIRNWPTLDLGSPRAATLRTALYSGNLGYAHDIDAFVAGCKRLHDKGYRIVVRGDGPGMRMLPHWISVRAPADDPAAIVSAYWDAEIHLVAAHPAIVRAVFPSKIWNSLATGRTLVTTGFSGVMADELGQVYAADYGQHCNQWLDLLERIASIDPSRTAGDGSRGRSPFLTAPHLRRLI